MATRSRGTPSPGLPPVTLSHKRSLIRFVLSGSRQGKLYRLSTGFQTTWTWRSAPHPGAELPPAWLCSLSGRRCKVQPMMTLNYKVHGMSLNGSTAAGRQVIGLTVGHLQLGGHAPITGATVQVSVDGGRTWRQATVKRTGAGQFTASFTAPAGAGVTLRTHATDSAGGSITETIDNAYRTFLTGLDRKQRLLILETTRPGLATNDRLPVCERTPQMPRRPR